MGKIYIDYTGASSTKNAKYHGGGNYSRWVINSLVDGGKDLYLLVNHGFEPISMEEKQLFLNESIKTVKIERLTNINFEHDSILFIPLISNRNLATLKKIKKRNTNLKIFVTIHGIRNIDLGKYDKYDKYYYRILLKRNCIYTFFKNKLVSFLTKYNLYRHLRHVDKVFTDSNYSLQNIIKYSKVDHIRMFHPGGDFKSFPTTSNKLNTYGKYILFLSANRIEKNFYRTLKAFITAVQTYTSFKTKLIVTGISSKNELKIKFSSVENKIIDNFVIFKGYIDSSELSLIYNNALYIVYTSKSEGYGLPLIEAALQNKVVLASYRTSIPEVIGSCAHYVNPYSLKSILNGMVFLENDTNRGKYEKNLQDLREMISFRKIIEKNNFLSEFEMEDFK